VLAVVQHQQQLLGVQELRTALAGVWPARAVSENTAATASSTPAASRTGASSASHAPSRTAAPHARRPAMPAGSCPPRPARSASPPAPWLERGRGLLQLRVPGR
jgi:hypothetical protein